MQQELRIKSLKVFITVAESGVMSTAASHLKITQARVSQTIRELEQLFGTELFERKNRPLELTKSGQILYRSALRFIEIEDETFAELRIANQRPRQHVHIAMANSFADAVSGALIEQIGDFADHWQLSSGVSPDHISLFLARRADMIVTVDEMLEQHDGLSRFELLREPYVLALPNSHVGKADLELLSESLPLIRYGHGGSTGRQIERHLARLNVRPPRQIEIESISGQMTLISHGQGWGLTTPLCFASVPSFFSSVRLAPLTRGAFRRQLNLICREREDSRLAQRVREASRDVLKYTALAPVLQIYPWLEPTFDFFE